jgi:N-formylglutamate amidohydrolase
MRKLLLAFFLIATLFTQAQNWTAGKIYSDPENWTEFRVGNIPLVITVPHGGSIDLDSIPDRSCPDAITVRDNNTKELALEIETEFMKQYGVRPFIIICNLLRKKVDQNREIELATCGNTAMRKPWNTFHDFTDTAIAMAVKQFGGCLYIDLHGHGHPIQRLELGYLLKESDLKQLNTDNSVEKFASKSSLQNLIKNSNEKLNFKMLMVGSNAFGTMMANEGIASVPSQQDIAPNAEEKYFNGGYNTSRYTSSKYPNCFGWQIETNYKGVRDAKGIPVFARAFAKVIPEFLKQNTSLSIPVKTQKVGAN